MAAADGFNLSLYIYEIYMNVEREVFAHVLVCVYELFQAWRVVC